MSFTAGILATSIKVGILARKAQTNTIEDLLRTRSSTVPPQLASRMAAMMTVRTMHASSRPERFARATSRLTKTRMRLNAIHSAAEVVVSAGVASLTDLTSIRAGTADRRHDTTMMRTRRSVVTQPTHTMTYICSVVGPHMVVAMPLTT